MNGLITGLSMFALGLGAVVLILIWHKYRIQRILPTPAESRAMWKARRNGE